MGGIAGSAFLTFRSNFELSYQIHVETLRQPVSSVLFKSEHNPDIELDVSYTFYDNWAVGFISTLSPEFIQSLVMNEIFVEISTNQKAVFGAPNERAVLVKGRLRSLHFYANFARMSIPPLLMSGSKVIPPLEDTPASGNANVYIDRKCHFHFEIFTEGFQADDEIELEMGLLLSQRDLKPIWAKRFHMSKDMSGVLSNLEPDFFEYLNVGQIYVQVTSKRYPRGEIRSKVMKTIEFLSKKIVPSICQI